MAETLKFGNLTIHFLGSNAAQLKSTFDSLYGPAAANTGSQTFRSTISETARYFRNIYVGGSLQDLEGVPGYEKVRINPNEVQNDAAFSRPLSADSYVIVVTGKEHTLVQDRRTFAGTTELAMAHEFMHPTQVIRELAETGKLRFGRDSETRAQMREQAIAAELGKKPGQDFPDVIGTGAPYRALLKSSESQPRLPTDGEIEAIRPQPGLPPIDDGKTAPNSKAPGRQGTLREMPQLQETQPTDQRLAFRATGQAAPVAARTLIEDGMMIEDRAVADRMNAIRGLMADRASEYWRGPKAEVLQQEYRDLVAMRDRSKARGASVEMEERHRTPVGRAELFSDGEAFQGPASWPEPDDKVAADRMAELQTLMADRHSEYWSGPKADALQQEYRDLFDLRERRKKREEQLLAHDDASWPDTTA